MIETCILSQRCLESRCLSRCNFSEIRGMSLVAGLEVYLLASKEAYCPCSRLGMTGLIEIDARAGHTAEGLGMNWVGVAHAEIEL